jgi:hypothetical protein
MHQPYGREFFIDDDEDTAGVRWDDFALALFVWAFMRAERDLVPVSVRAAADEFGVTEAVVREALADQMYVRIVGPDDDPAQQRIEFDGW